MSKRSGFSASLTAVPQEDPPFLQDLVLSLLGVGQHPAEPELKRTQASYWETRLKHLPKGHALVHIANQTIEVETLMVPPAADQRDLNRIKEEYSNRLQKPNMTTKDPSRRQSGKKESTPSVENDAPPVDIQAIRQTRRRSQAKQKKTQE